MHTNPGPRGYQGVIGATGLSRSGSQNIKTPSDDSKGTYLDDIAPLLLHASVRLDLGSFRVLVSASDRAVAHRDPRDSSKGYRATWRTRFLFRKQSFCGLKIPPESRGRTARRRKRTIWKTIAYKPLQLSEALKEFIVIIEFRICIESNHHHDGCPQ